MRVLFLSDIHIHPQHPTSASEFCEFLDALCVDRLVVLGDLFDCWWSTSQPPVIFLRVLSAFERCKSRGIELWWLPGNHDFDFQRSAHFEALFAHCPQRYKLGQQQVSMSHGDEAVCGYAYRIWRSFLQGPVFRCFMDALGERAFDVAQRLSNYDPTQHQTSRALIGEQREWSREQLADVVLMGHSHFCGTEELDGRQLFWLGDWEHHRSGLVWENERWNLHRGLSTDSVICQPLAIDSARPS